MVDSKIARGNQVHTIYKKDYKSRRPMKLIGRGNPYGGLKGRER